MAYRNRVLLAKIESATPGNVATVEVDVKAGRVRGTKLTVQVHPQAQAVTVTLLAQLPNAAAFAPLDGLDAQVAAADVNTVFDLDSLISGKLRLSILTGVTGPTRMDAFLYSLE